MSAPTGDRQIKWFVTVEETDNALREEPNHEENWNNSEEIFGLLLTTHVCCSPFIYSPAEWGKFMVCYWSTIWSWGEMKWQQSLAVGPGSGRASHYLDRSCGVWLSWIPLLGRQLERDCFYYLHGRLSRSIGYWNLFLNKSRSHVYSHTNHPAGGEITSGRCGNRPLSRNKWAFRPALDK